MNILGFFQRLGRALQLPIAVLPVAALLLRFGQPDLLNVPFIAQAGGAIFDNLALIFAIGVASSWSKDSAGAAALAATGPRPDARCRATGAGPLPAGVGRAGRVRPAPDVVAVGVGFFLSVRVCDIQ